jgi:aldehyde:ferredoxin oxidoreductase
MNLTTGTSQKETIPEKIVRDYVGGRGFGIKYLYQELAPGIDPLSADNKLLFTIGPLAGTGAIATSRWMVIAKSPLTNTYFRSVAGADFGAWLRWAGIDLLIIEGQAAKPVYLYIKEDGIEIKEAAELWGKGTIETQEKLKQIHGDGIRIACIGPAGEKLVRYSAIMSDLRTAGRGGMGTVMGSKNLKAIVIDVGRKVDLPNPEEFRGLIKEQVAALGRSKRFPIFSDAGTPGDTESFNRMGFFPVANFRYGTLEGYEKISLEEYAKLKVKDTRCYACSIHCGNELGSSVRALIMRLYGHLPVL